MQCGGETLGCLLILSGELKPHRAGTGEQNAGEEPQQSISGGGNISTDGKLGLEIQYGDNYWLISWLFKYFVEICKKETRENASMGKKKGVKFQVCELLKVVGSL